MIKWKDGWIKQLLADVDALGKKEGGNEAGGLVVAFCSILDSDLTFFS